jgi:plastocyanin
MIKVFVVNKRWLRLTVVTLLLAAAAVLYLNRFDIVAVTGLAPGEERTIHLVTGEFKSTASDGKQIEAYRWDPGTIYIRKGERVKLSIWGVNGESHPFIIEGMNVRGEVKKGKETVVSLKPEKEGVYRIICLTHPDIAHSGPMIGYIVVED